MQYMLNSLPFIEWRCVYAAKTIPSPHPFPESGIPNEPSHSEKQTKPSLNHCYNVGAPGFPNAARCLSQRPIISFFASCSDKEKAPTKSLRTPPSLRNSADATATHVTQGGIMQGNMDDTKKKVVMQKSV